MVSGDEVGVYDIVKYPTAKDLIDQLQAELNWWSDLISLTKASNVILRLHDQLQNGDELTAIINSRPKDHHSRLVYGFPDESYPQRGWIRYETQRNSIGSGWRFIGENEEQEDRLRSERNVEKKNVNYWTLYEEREINLIPPEDHWSWGVGKNSRDRM